MVAPPQEESAVPQRRVMKRPDVSTFALIGSAIVGVIYLVRARLHHARFRTSDIEMRNARSASREKADIAEANERIGQICWIVPRVAKFMPFRSDCLVQAMAAQDWLDRHSIATRIVIGVKRNDTGEMESHAWLQNRSSVILGGEISTFEPILG